MLRRSTVAISFAPAAASPLWSKLRGRRAALGDRISFAALEFCLSLCLSDVDCTGAMSWTSPLSFSSPICAESLLVFPIGLRPLATSCFSLDRDGCGSPQVEDSHLLLKSLRSRPRIKSWTCCRSTPSWLRLCSCPRRTGCHSGVFPIGLRTLAAIGIQSVSFQFQCSRVDQLKITKSKARCRSGDDAYFCR